METVNAESAPSTMPATEPLNGRPRLLFALGAALFILGPVIYFIQIRLRSLNLPWHIPVLATIGTVLMVLSARQRRGRGRIIGLVLLTVVCGVEWLGILYGVRAPSYTGPAQAGQRLPVFAASRADGKPFTQSDLEGDESTVLLFFRGRW